jgi:hypothetical protein
MREMRKKYFLKKSSLAILFLGAFIAFGSDMRSRNSQPQAAASPSPEDVAQKISLVSIPFVPNAGRFPGEVKFSAGLFCGSFFVTDKNLTYSLDSLSLPSANSSAGKDGVIVFKEAFLDGVNRPILLSPQGEKKAVTKVSYFQGDDPRQWQSNISTYSSVSIGMVYPGIVAKLRATGKNVEKLFILYPGADAEAIRIRVEGSDSLEISPEGKLVIRARENLVAMRQPLGYQEEEGKKRPVRVSYEMKSEDIYGFKVGGKYNPEIPLVIDPSLEILSASTFIGGKEKGRFTQGDCGYSIALDGSGNVYVTGSTDATSIKFPTTPGAYDTSHNGGTDVFVCTLDSSLSLLLASTFIGGKTSDYGYSLALDNSSYVFVTGRTESSNFPTTPGAYDRTFNNKWSGADVFVSKLDNSLKKLLASTFLGGKDSESGFAIAIDFSGNPFIAGRTNSVDFPATAAAYDRTFNGSGDAFVSKLNGSLASLLASTFLGGKYSDYANAIALDLSGNAYIAGSTYSPNFPTTPGAYDPTPPNNIFDAFISELDSSFSTLLASTVLGGWYHDHGLSLVLDSLGNVFITGNTGSKDFPTTPGAYDTTFNSKSSSQSDVFVSKLAGTTSTR